MAASNDQIAERITALAGPVVDGYEVELVEVEIKGQRGSRVVRIIADADDGLDLDLITGISRDLNELLDEDDVVDGRYTLEVSSPGVDRPLRTATNFRRNIGREVRVIRTREAIDRGEKGELTGSLDAADEDGLTMTVGKQTVHVPLADVDHGKVVLPW